MSPLGPQFLDFQGKESVEAMGEGSSAEKIGRPMQLV